MYDTAKCYLPPGILMTRAVTLPHMLLSCEISCSGLECAPRHDIIQAKRGIASTQQQWTTSTVRSIVNSGT